jgi:hypothetical protein
MSIYCTYLTVYKGNKLPKFYIGSTSINRIENGYVGSVTSKKYAKIWKYEVRYNKHLFKTKIISKHSSRQEAFEKELSLQLALNVQKNPLYVNLGYAQPNGCYGLGLKGKDHWSKQPGMVHNAKTNHPRGMLGKKHPESRNRYMSEIQMGEKNHFYGKNHTDDAIEAIRKKARNKIWVTDGVKNLKLEKTDNIPEGWRRGRTLSAENSPSNMKWINNGKEERFVKKNS